MKKWNELTEEQQNRILYHELECFWSSFDEEDEKDYLVSKIKEEVGIYPDKSNIKLISKPDETVCAEMDWRTPVFVPHKLVGIKLNDVLCPSIQIMSDHFSEPSILVDGTDSVFGDTYLQRRFIKWVFKKANKALPGIIEKVKNIISGYHVNFNVNNVIKRLESEEFDYD